MATLTKYDKVNKCYVVKPNAPQGELIQKLGKLEHGGLTGYWIGVSDGEYEGSPVYDEWHCSECGYVASDDDRPPQFNYCPECGCRILGSNPEIEG